MNAREAIGWEVADRLDAAAVRQDERHRRLFAEQQEALDRAALLRDVARQLRQGCMLMCVVPEILALLTPQAEQVTNDDLRAIIWKVEIPAGPRG
ncbi:hypothetical protein UFOVP843_4 [uncultured Caudovirales phage]|uniref:Uncharacterized protein n=1 Tax=uncultured Caudovirales phage TaxID=2100421 RepID=A0A6J5PLI6_9CAUD|nr:hypothetical protein UFOVP843_4 [uncultured Caudovirales phage]CAB4172443.1 hypothetical protein UFOVP936_21 [uncultured Caudovirales phage]